MVKKQQNRPKPGRESGAAVAPAVQTGLELIARQVFSIAEPLCDAEGIELVFVEFHSEPAGRVVRVYIDKPGGITLDDCAAVSRQLTDVLDVSLEDMGAYNLEVSSPGPERPLGRVADFERFKGKKIRVQTSRPLDGRKSFTGILAGFMNGQVTLMIDKETVSIPHTAIKRARLINHGD
ncbi:MAG: ribosome maturation factor RimP [Desulfobacterales bacterium]